MNVSVNKLLMCWTAFVGSFLFFKPQKHLFLQFLAWKLQKYVSHACIFFPHVTTWEFLSGSAWHFILWGFTKIHQHFPVLVKLTQGQILYRKMLMKFFGFSSIMPANPIGFRMDWIGKMNVVSTLRTFLYALLFFIWLNELDYLYCVILWSSHSGRILLLSSASVLCCL